MLRTARVGCLLSLGWLVACSGSDSPGRTPEVPPETTTTATASPADLQEAETQTIAERQGSAGATILEEAAQLLTQGNAGNPKDAVLKIFDWLKQVGRFGQSDNHYFFKVEDLEEIARLGIGKPTREMFDTVHRELLRRYPGKIAESYRFIINDAGGALGQVAILYASLNEYLIFFGSPLSNNGHSGRYNAEFWDIMMDGEMNTFIEGEVERTVYLPGQTAHLPKGQAKVYQLVDHGWMLEYSRGNMIELFPFGVIAPAMFVTLDWESAWKQISDFGALVLKNVFVP